MNRCQTSPTSTVKARTLPLRVADVRKVDAEGSVDLVAVAEGAVDRAAEAVAAEVVDAAAHAAAVEIVAIAKRS